MRELRTLGSLGEMWTGFQVRSAIADVPEAPHRLITLGDVVDGVVSLDRAARMDLGGRIGRHSLLEGDILLRPRGANTKAAVVLDLDMPTVAVAPLWVLRLRVDTFLPDYVVWWINRCEVQEKLAAAARGSHIPSVPREAFADLEIPIPPLGVQNEIAEVERLRVEERELAARLAAARSVLIESTLEQAATGQTRIR